MRLWDLGSPTDKGTPVFDEKHYLPQAWQMLRNGGYEDNPGYELVVHPPLGKHLIALGEWLFGYNTLGWRFASAIADVVCVADRAPIDPVDNVGRAGWAVVDLCRCEPRAITDRDAGYCRRVVRGGGVRCLLVDRDVVRGRLAIAVRQAGR